VRGWSEAGEGRDRFPNGHELCVRGYGPGATLPPPCSGIKLRKNVSTGLFTIKEL
jgi:hypothetical protein